jgi:hypothetical protein
MPKRSKASFVSSTVESRSDALRRQLRLTHLTSAADLGLALRWSQPTVSRALASLGDQVVRLGRARAARYALARPLGRLGHRWPLHEIDAQGRASAVGFLVAAGAGGFVLEPEATSSESTLSWAAPEARAKPGQPIWFDGWPWFLIALWPSGFMGHALARRCASGGWVAADLTQWGADDVLWMALMQGHDAPGHWVLGDVALQRALASIVEPRDVIAASERAALYPLMAQAALQSEGSSGWVEGTQPCFTAVVRGDAGDGERPLPNVSTLALTSLSRPGSQQLGSRSWRRQTRCGLGPCAAAGAGSSRLRGQVQRSRAHAGWPALGRSVALRSHRQWGAQRARHGGGNVRSHQSRGPRLS